METDPCGIPKPAHWHGSAYPDEIRHVHADGKAYTAYRFEDWRIGEGRQPFTQYKCRSCMEVYPDESSFGDPLRPGAPGALGAAGGSVPVADAQANADPDANRKSDTEPDPNTHPFAHSFPCPDPFAHAKPPAIKFTRTVDPVPPADPVRRARDVSFAEALGYGLRVADSLGLAGRHAIAVGYAIGYDAACRDAADELE